MCIPLGLHPIGVNLSFDFVANGHEMRRETHLSRRDSMIVAWHEVPGSVQEGMTRPEGTVEIAFRPRHVGLEFQVVPL